MRYKVISILLLGAWLFVFDYNLTRRVRADEAQRIHDSCREHHGAQILNDYFNCRLMQEGTPDD